MTSKKPPQWYGKTYGHFSEQAWNEAVDRTRDILVDWAKKGSIGTYGDLITDLGMLDWPDGPYTHHGSQIGKLLGDASVADWLEDRPLVSALVISWDGGGRGDGFYGLCEELLADVIGSSEDAKDRVQAREVARCHEYWGGNKRRGPIGSTEQGEPPYFSAIIVGRKGDDVTLAATSDLATSNTILAGRARPPGEDYDRSSSP